MLPNDSGSSYNSPVFDLHRLIIIDVAHRIHIVVYSWVRKWNNWSLNWDQV